MDRKQLMEKWAPILEHSGASPIKDNYRKEVTAVLLENQERSLREEKAAMFEAVHANAAGAMPDAGGVAKFDPVLISLVRRSAPQMIAYDICGVQPMTQPTGLIFAMKAKYTNQAGAEALFNEADSDFSGTGTHAGSNPVDGTYTTGAGMSTTAAEGLGDTGTFGEMAFSIEKTSVVAKSRALKAEYTIELAQDLKSVHGLDAEGELSNILATEILAEINREVIRTVYTSAKTGAAVGTATPGVFDLDVDANGRWSVEKFKGLLFQIEREANAIAQTTRRGKGNFIICSADVASALQMAGVLDYAPALAANNGLNVDDASTTFAGILNGRYKVYVDPYSANQSNTQYCMVGYKGASAFDAGLFYCPYVPLQMVRAVDPQTFQPKIGFKTRYGMTANPFVQLDGTGDMIAGENYYYRKFKVTNLM
jgi:hypothetical protein